MEERSEHPVRWHIVFEGDVQFVGFRYTARLIARKLGLSGWVKNLPDGRVDLAVQGPVSDLRRFLLQMKSQPHIHISRYTITVLDPDPAERRFSVRDTME
ncbi:MAG: acylphosphatase [Clostridia bacterium]|nr:acylphosphatase [Clostridia bacterium]